MRHGLRKGFVEPASDAERLARIGALIGKAVRAGPIGAPETQSRRPNVPASAPWERVFDETEQRILRYLSESGEASPKMLTTALGIAHSTLVRRLRDLGNRRLILVSGATRSVKYRISDPTPQPPVKTRLFSLQQRILYYLAAVGKSSPVQIQQALKVRRITLARHLRCLRERGLVTVLGKTRRAKYQLGVSQGQGVYAGVKN